MPATPAPAAVYLSRVDIPLQPTTPSITAAATVPTANLFAQTSSGQQKREIPAGHCSHCWLLPAVAPACWRTYTSIIPAQGSSLRRESTRQIMANAAAFDLGSQLPDGLVLARKTSASDTSIPRAIPSGGKYSLRPYVRNRTERQPGGQIAFVGRLSPKGLTDLSTINNSWIDPMRHKAIFPLAVAVLIGLAVVIGLALSTEGPGSAQADESRDREGSRKPLSTIDREIKAHADRMIEEGRQIFRFDTFGSEAFFGDALQLHKAIAGVSPKAALAVGLKVDADALPGDLKAAIKAGKVNLDDPATTLALLKLNAVVGVAGLFDDAGRIRSMGIQCAFCHATVDNSFAPGIGRRLDGWANRDLNVGAILSLAPNLKPFTDLLGVDEATVKKVFASWGPGRFDAVLDKDGKAFRPDGGQAGTLIPPAFGLAGVNLHTWTGFGSVPYWNAYVAVTEMHGSGTFFDERLNNKDQYPVAAKSGAGNTRDKPDLVTSKLAALHFYQVAIPAPTPPKGSFDKAAAARGKDIFNGRAQCATCHVPPLFTEPGHNLHTPEEMGIDSFQADRSPTRMYRTAPLAGLWTHQKGGFYHDGRFATLRDLIEHYNRNFRLGLTDQEKVELIEYLKSL